jgi:hypothetical protein
MLREPYRRRGSRWTRLLRKAAGSTGADADAIRPHFEVTSKNHRPLEPRPEAFKTSTRTRERYVGISSIGPAMAIQSAQWKESRFSRPRAQFPGAKVLDRNPPVT